MSPRNHILPVLPLALSVLTAGGVLSSYVGCSGANGGKDARAESATAQPSAPTSKILTAPSASTSK
jgi:hypothetical protein